MNFFQQNSEQSIESIKIGGMNDLSLLRQMRFSQKRTHTYESMDSSSLSENSYVDIKFMQNHRTKREVSKLIR